MPIASAISLTLCCLLLCSSALSDESVFFDPHPNDSQRSRSPALLAAPAEGRGLYPHSKHAGQTSKPAHSQPSKTLDQLYVVTELNAAEIPEGYSSYRAITSQEINFDTNTFAVRTNLGWITRTEFNRLKLAKGRVLIFSPFGSKAFGLESLTESPPTPYEKMKARIVVFQHGQPKWQFDFKGFKNFDADWIDEAVLRIVSWPGTRVKVTELINVETGRVLYRSADGIYDRLGPPPGLRESK